MDAFDMDKRRRRVRVVDGCRSGCDALAGRVMGIKKTKGREKRRWVRKGRHCLVTSLTAGKVAVKRRRSMESDGFATFFAEGWLAS
jgi:hypothetical protein